MLKLRIKTRRRLKRQLPFWFLSSNRCISLIGIIVVSDAIQSFFIKYKLSSCIGFITSIGFLWFVISFIIQNSLRWITQVIHRFTFRSRILTFIFIRSIMLSFWITKHSNWWIWFLWGVFIIWTLLIYIVRIIRIFFI